jgi:transcriptional regulator with XRE-family HTH domain
MKKRQKSPLDDLKGFREARGENQTTFWTRFGVTQSGGSRYESGRALPTPVAMLVAAFAQGLLSDEMLAKVRPRANAGKKVSQGA